MTERFLIDKSALARRSAPAVREALAPLHKQGLLAVCGPVEMEILYSARNSIEAQKLGLWLRGFDYLAMPDEVWDRAKQVQLQAISKANHRALSLADLLIAATAERHNATVLHYDGDFDMIAAMTGQATRWVAEPGSAN